jgi:RNA polymerase sigma-70 factor (ECF subfamily)
MDASLLQQACEAGRAAWPEIELDDARFCSFVAERARPGERELRWADLWLACACLDGNELALATLERWGFPAVDGALARLRISDDDRRELKQALRARLLVAEGERRPRLAEFAGRGDLRGFLRVAATRFALNYLRGRKRDNIPVGDQLPQVMIDPALAPVQARYREACERALAEAIAQLGVRDRNLLRQHLIDGIQIQHLAALYRVHRVTIARWLEDARARVLDLMQTTLRASHGVDDRELESVVRLVRSQLDVSLSRRLRE